MPARFTLALALALSALPSSAAGFTGEWAVRVCAKGVQDCGSYTVNLFQQGDRLCGSHAFATQGFGQFDEGGDTSIAGDVIGAQGIGPAAQRTLWCGIAIPAAVARQYARVEIHKVADAPSAGWPGPA